MGPLVSSKMLENEDMNPTKVQPDNGEGLYYGIFLPPDVVTSPPLREALVFGEKSDAMKVLKKYKRARFKAFRLESEAQEFALHGAEPPVGSNETSTALSEKTSPFKVPKPQDFVRLRKYIETGDIETVMSMVDENPRYLVSSGDTPSILQEGSRYNALHVAARSSQPKVTEFVLSSISKQSFIRRLYGEQCGDAQELISERCRVLVDLYLNTPDKGLNETPLHFASKIGAKEVIEVLVSYPQCDKERKNKYGETPADIICSRDKGDDSNLKREISVLLGEHYYVPVLRSEDVSVQAVVGDPFPVGSPPPCPSSPIPVLSPLKVRAVAGPMTEDEAKAFRKLWKSPSVFESPKCNREQTGRKRLRRGGLKSPVLQLHFDVKNQHKEINSSPTLCDPEKGLELVGRKLAYENKINWTEYWSFLDAFVDLKTPEGLDLLERYLANKVVQITNKNDINQRMEEDVAKTRRKKRVKQANPVVPQQPLSPLSELCDSFGKLRLDGSGDHIHLESSLCDEKDSDIQPYQMYNMSQVYARRLVASIIQYSVRSIEAEVAHFQTFLSGCMKDKRFKIYEPEKAHSYFAQLCATRLGYTDRSIALHNLNSLSRSFPKSVNGIDNHPLKCILGTIRSLLLKKHFEGKSWHESSPCCCPLVQSHRPRRVPLFRLRPDSPINFTSGPLGRVSQDNCINGEESDSSDSEYFTPPSSPQWMDSSSDESIMYTPFEGIDVFIGGHPSKMDLAVLEAISPVNIKPSKYPYICQWKQACLSYSPESRDSWPTPTISSPRKCRGRSDESYLTPSWHRSRF